MRVSAAGALGTFALSPVAMKGGMSFQKTSCEYTCGNLLVKIMFHAMIGRRSNMQFNRYFMMDAVFTRLFLDELLGDGCQFIQI